MTKLLVGILAFSSLVYTVVFLIYFTSIIFQIFSAASTSTATNFPNSTFFTFIILNMFFAAVNLGLMIYMIYNVFHNKKVAQNQRIMWVILLVLLNVFTTPVYWYKFIK